MATRRQGSTLALTASGVAIAPSWPAATLAGSLLVGIVYSRDSDETPNWSPPDETWTLAVASTPTTDTPRTLIYYIENSASRSGAESFTHDGVAKPLAAWVEEWEPGAGETITLDQVASAVVPAGGSADRPTGTTPTTAGATIQVGGVCNRNGTRTLTSIQDLFTQRVNGSTGTGFTHMVVAGGSKLEAAAEAGATGWTVNNVSGSTASGAIAAFLVAEGGADATVTAPAATLLGLASVPVPELRLLPAAAALVGVAPAASPSLRLLPAAATLLSLAAAPVPELRLPAPAARLLGAGTGVPEVRLLPTAAPLLAVAPAPSVSAGGSATVSAPAAFLLGVAFGVPEVRVEAVAALTSLSAFAPVPELRLLPAASLLLQVAPTPGITAGGGAAVAAPAALVLGIASGVPAVGILSPPAVLAALAGAPVPEVRVSAAAALLLASASGEGLTLTDVAAPAALVALLAIAPVPEVRVLPAAALLLLAATVPQIGGKPWRGPTGGEFEIRPTPGGTLQVVHPGGTIELRPGDGGTLLP